MLAAASLVTLLARSPPDRPIGVDAPTLVPGAMAATGHDISTNAPAEAARAPLGATWPTTGRELLRLPWSIWSIDDPSPPGVSIVSRTAASWSPFARWITDVMWSA